MNIIEAAGAMRAGKIVNNRPSVEAALRLSKEGRLIEFSCGHWVDARLSDDDLLADDWEIVEEQNV